MAVSRHARDEENFSLALQRYRKVIKTYARNSYFVVPGYNADDMEQELLAVLWFVVQTYDPTKGAFFNSYMQQCFRNKIGSLRRETQAQKRTAEVVSLDVEAVQHAIDSRRTLPSAEETALLREECRESYEQGPARIRRRWQTQLAEAI